MPIADSRSPAQLIALLLAAPSMVGALWIAATALGTMSPVPAPGFASLADAIQHGEVEDAYASMSAGADPNATIPFSDPNLTAGHTVMISPLMLAVAANKENTVMMLLSFGARMDVPQNELAPCLAKRLGYPKLAAMIVRDGRPVRDVACPDPPVDAPAPLLAFVKSGPETNP